MKALITLLAVVVSLSMSGFTLARAANLANEGLEHGPACASSVMRIEHTYLRQDGDSTYHGSQFSLGTAIAPNIILTHNHFYKTTEPFQDEALTLFDAAGVNRPMPVPIAVDEGATLIYLPHTVSLPMTPTSDRSTLEHLSAGDRLTVCYWDDARNRLAQQDFKIVRIKDGVATLADPGRVINPGDSGGGAFFEGRLVGNTWARQTDPDGNPLGAFDVALLSAQTQGLLAATGLQIDNAAHRNFTPSSSMGGNIE